jgi:hypothetical protein
VHKDLLAHSPLLALPLAALVLFFVVFVLVTVRALTRSKADVAREAALPLAEEGRRHES